MKKEDLSVAVSNIDMKYTEEAENYDMSKRNFIKHPLSRVAVAAIITVCLVIGCTAATTFTKWESFISFFDKDGNETKVNVTDEAFFKELPDGIPVPGDGEPKIPMIKAEAEKVLGFPILGSSLSEKNVEYYYNAYKNEKNDDVATVDLWCANFINESDNKSVSLSAEILSVNAEEGYIYPFIEGKDAAGGKVFLEKHKIEALGVSAVIYALDDAPERIKATFVYDSVYYSLSFKNYSTDEIKEVLGTLR